MCLGFAVLLALMVATQRILLKRLVDIKTFIGIFLKPQRVVLLYPSSFGSRL